jgi:hypothetical protein
MSRAHRDDQELVGAGAHDATSAGATTAQPAVSNSEAARRAKERRDAEAEQASTEHQFTGDLPEPSRGDEDDGAPRTTDGDRSGDEAALARAASAALRGPPPPIAAHHDGTSWAASTRMDALASFGDHADARWVAPPSRNAAMLAAKDTPRWTR